jgi:hypothetical protein
MVQRCERRDAAGGIRTGTPCSRTLAHWWFLDPRIAASALRSRMLPAPQSTDTTYLIETRDGSEVHVRSMLEKYYDGLLTDVIRNPGDCSGVLLVETTHELPSDAFRRYSEVEGVLRADIAVPNWRPESVSSSCVAVVADLSAGATVSLTVTLRGTTADSHEIRRQCENALSAAGLVVDGTSSTGTEVRVHVVGEWDVVSVRR